MARRLIIAAAAALVLALPAPAGAASPLAGSHWTVQRIGKHVMPAGFGAELRFQARRRWTGRDDCNIATRHYRLSKGRLLLLGARGRMLARLTRLP